MRDGSAHLWADALRADDPQFITPRLPISAARRSLSGAGADPRTRKFGDRREAKAFCDWPTVNPSGSIHAMRLAAAMCWHSPMRAGAEAPGRTQHRAQIFAQAARPRTTKGDTTPCRHAAE